MRNFTKAADAGPLSELVQQALELKANPLAYRHLGKNRTLGLFFMNSSLRTRISTEKAARNLGMEVQIMNGGSDTWALEFTEGAVMDGLKVEHIKDAAAVMGSYFDIIGLRCFAGLKNRDEDYAEQVLNGFIKYSGVPLVSLESATRHPLQSLADLVTITENTQKPKPKIVLSWAPHIKPIPQAVANSFAEWMLASGADLTITHPEGFELAPEFTAGANIEYNQSRALAGADFVYLKNWSAYTDYGLVHPNAENWLLTEKRLAGSEAKIMHCLPVRRNIEVADELLDGPRSLVQQQAANRLWAAQAVLKQVLEGL